MPNPVTQAALVRTPTGFPRSKIPSLNARVFGFASRDLPASMTS